MVKHRKTTESGRVSGKRRHSRIQNGPSNETPPDGVHLTGLGGTHNTVSCGVMVVFDHRLALETNKDFIAGDTERKTPPNGGSGEVPLGGTDDGSSTAVQ
jgi:hypothetical protein